MRIGLQREAEVAEIFRIIIGLRHGPQRGNVDQFRIIRALCLRQKPIEVRSLEDLPFGQL